MKNIYKAVVDKLGKEDEERCLPNPYGATAIRSWKCGCVVVRSIELGEMNDKYEPCQKHKKDKKC